MMLLKYFSHFTGEYKETPESDRINQSPQVLSNKYFSSNQGLILRFLEMP